MTEETKPTAASAQPKKNKKWIVLGIVVAVIAIVCIGGFAWHNTPSFCGTVCHTTMSEHVANYEGTDASQGAGLAHLHATAKVTCLDCHKAGLDTQLAELNSQLSGNVGNLDLSARYYMDNATCLSCHGGSYESLATKTAGLGDYNPHANPHGEMNCNECHKAHSTQVDTCGDCHDNGGQTMKG